MKTLLSFLLHIILLSVSFQAVSQTTSNIQQPTSINTDGAAPDASALLDVKATDKGMLVPRMTTAQRTGIASPATGLLVFDTTTGNFWFYNGTTWVNLASPKVLADADGDTKIQVEESPDEDVIRFDLGGSEKMVLHKNANGLSILSLYSSLNNTFVGQDAGNGNSTGNYNTAFGALPLYSNTIGNKNTAIGANALFLNTADNNSATGASALFSNSTGSGNTANGAEALYSNTSGSSNTAVGDGALFSNTSGFINTANGKGSLYSNSSGIGNTANGYWALNSNTTGSDNTATGSIALWSNSTGYQNMATGYGALALNSTGFNNTASGAYSLYANNGNSNTAQGFRALYSNDLGHFNTANGVDALYSNSIGSGNTAVGEESLYSNANGQSNTASGSAALYSNTSGTGNTASGYQALLQNTTGNANSAFGDGADVLSGNLNHATAIGAGAKVACSNCLVLGDGVNVGIGLSTPVSDMHIIQKIGTSPLDKLGLRLQDPDGTFWNIFADIFNDFSFANNGNLASYIQDGSGTYVAVSDARLKNSITPLGQVLDGALKLSPKWYHRIGYEDSPKTLGFIAQEVEQVFPELVFEKDGVKGLAYDYFGILAIKAMQEQQAIIDTQQAEIHKLKKLEIQLEKITAALQVAGIELK